MLVLHPNPAPMQHHTLTSKYLKREVLIHAVVPRNSYLPNSESKLLVLNDGQDSEAYQLKEVLADWEQNHPGQNIVALAVNVGERKQEYGISNRPDFAQRGSRALEYARFIENELLPWAFSSFHVSKKPEDAAISGFSLGALSAFDLAWTLPHVFGTAGLFSGSFWWRSKDLNHGYKPGDRIAIQCINEEKTTKNLRFWFQTGWLDEGADRDHDGLIDSIGDTLDVIRALQRIGYKPGTDIEYVELGSGHHDHKTMAKVFPQFLQWWILKNNNGTHA
jgi:enterochelin esterase family protein